jgi:hypothetical protein
MLEPESVIPVSLWRGESARMPATTETDWRVFPK